MCQSFMESLYNGQIYISTEEAKEQREAIFPVVIVDSKNKIVDYCLNKEQAIENIKKRNNAIILIGRLPKKYKIITSKTFGEYDKRRTKLESDRKSKSSI